MGLVGAGDDPFIGCAVVVDDDHQWLGWVRAVGVVLNADQVPIWTVLVEDDYDHRLRERPAHKLRCLEREVLGDWPAAELDRLRRAAARRAQVVAETKAKLRALGSAEAAAEKRAQRPKPRKSSVRK